MPPSAIFLRSDNFLEPGLAYQYKPRLASNQQDNLSDESDTDLETKMLRDAVVQEEGVTSSDEECEDKPMKYMHE